MCIANPYCVTDVGTDLSVLSVLSLVTVYPFSLQNFKLIMLTRLIKLQGKVDRRHSFRIRNFYTSVCVFVLQSLFCISFRLCKYCRYGFKFACRTAWRSVRCYVILTYFVSLFGIIPLTAFAVLLATKCDALLIDFVCCSEG